jgi:hypothetical protein
MGLRGKLLVREYVCEVRILKISNEFKEQGM